MSADNVQSRKLDERARKQLRHGEDLHRKILQD